LPLPAPARRRERLASVPLARRCSPLRRLLALRRPRPRPARRALVDGGSRRAGANRRNAMSSRTCPDWPDLMEIAPDLQFKHYTVAEAQLPADALMQIKDISLADVAV